MNIRGSVLAAALVIAPALADAQAPCAGRQVARDSVSALADCLSDPNPEVRDAIAFETLSTLLRSGAVDASTLRSLRDRLLLGAFQSRSALDTSFHALTLEEKDAVLTQVNKNEIDFAALGEADLKPAHFFSQLLSDTKHGYLADPMYGGNKGMKAWIAIGFPGARASFTEWVKQHNVPYPLGPVSVKGERA
jgi:hypothetical protein